MVCLLLPYLFTKCVITSVKTCSPASAQCHVAIHTTCASEMLQIMGSPLVPKPPANIFFYNNESFISDQAECYIAELNLCLFRKKKVQGPFQTRDYLGGKKKVKGLAHKMPKHTASTFRFCVLFSQVIWRTVKSTESNQQGKIRERTKWKISLSYSKCKKIFSTYKLLTLGADSSFPGSPSSPQVFYS